jgi:hypothetical protein
MNDDDPAQGIALLTVALVVALVLALTLGVAVSRTGARSAAAAGGGAAAAPGEPPPTVLSFEAASAALPAQAFEALDSLSQALRQQEGTALLVVPFVAAGQPGQADLAVQRARAVAHAVEANGVDRGRIVIDPPARAASGSDPQRVELRLR